MLDLSSVANFMLSFFSHGITFFFFTVRIDWSDQYPALNRNFGTALISKDKFKAIRPDSGQEYRGSIVHFRTQTVLIAGQLRLSQSAQSSSACRSNILRSVIFDEENFHAK